MSAARRAAAPPAAHLVDCRQGLLQQARLLAQQLALLADALQRLAHLSASLLFIKPPLTQLHHALIQPGLAARGAHLLTVLVITARV
jgi:hypothetical protein